MKRGFYDHPVVLLLPFMRFKCVVFSACAIILFLKATVLFSETAEIVIPRISQRITIDDFAGMVPRQEIADQLAIVQDFIQSAPKDGAPPTQQTVVYMAYDEHNLYVVFVCFDNEAHKISAAMTRREAFGQDEDWIEIYLDTYSDQRRSYCFSTNPFGVQWDSRYSETGAYGDNRGHQPSFDALWYSDGRITDKGYIVWMAIPFKSLRFPSGDIQKWRMMVGRSIPRNNEYSSWPHRVSDIQGFLTQTSFLNGLENVSPGRSLQFIPYTSFRSFKLLDSEASPPAFIRDASDPSVGMDTKLVLKDSHVFDLALNPDFSQIESDEPQVTVNQRFEVFFREKRPFFLENAQYFETPLNLVFTRRIADPQFGGRLTGKSGPYTMGFLFANDEAPGKTVPVESPLYGDDAYFGIARLTRDIFQQSSIGALFTTRNFQGSTNSIAGGDFRLRLNDHWQANAQFVGSRTDLDEGERLSGHAYHGEITRTGRQFGMEVFYEDISPEFRTFTGFIPRVDYRSIEGNTHYYFRPEGKVLVAWGPEINALELWDFDGTRLDSSLNPSFYVELQRLTYVRLNYFHDHQRIRPEDFPGLLEDRDFATPEVRFNLDTSFFKRATIRATYGFGKDINFVPAEGQFPEQSNFNSGELELIMRPIHRLQIRGNYLYTGLHTRDDATIFNDHIVSLRSNYQFTKEFSLRVILQYESTLVNPALTSLEDRRNLNADVLFTYMVNPWTALYVGYNGNRQNLSLIDEIGITRLIRTRGTLLNDANQFFMKFSYLIRI
jgi:hypothetical protein